MPWTPLLKAVQLFLYFLLAAQGAFYLLGLHKVMAAMPPSDFVALRKLANPVLEPRLKVLYMLTLLSSVFVLILSARQRDSFGFLLISIATALMLADLVLAMRLSIPLNARVAAVHTKPDAALFQALWLRQIYVRAILAVSGFAILVAGTTFPKPDS